MKTFFADRRISGYFTIEASLIVPYVFILLMLSILLSFFLYNHCILYQSCYLAALRGQQLKEVSDSGMESYINVELSKLLNEQIYQYQVNGCAEVTPFTVSVTARTSFENSLKNFGLYDEELFESEKIVKVVRINPSETIRTKYNLYR